MLIIQQSFEISTKKKQQLDKLKMFNKYKGNLNEPLIKNDPFLDHIMK